MFVKMGGHIWLEVEMPNRRASKDSAIDNRTPFERVFGRFTCAF